MVDRAGWLIGNDDLLNPRKVEQVLAIRISPPRWSNFGLASATVTGWLAHPDGRGYVYFTGPETRSADPFKASLRLSLEQAPCITVALIARRLDLPFRKSRPARTAAAEYQRDISPQASQANGVQHPNGFNPFYEGLALRFTNDRGN